MNCRSQHLNTNRQTNEMSSQFNVTMLSYEYLNFDGNDPAVNAPPLPSLKDDGETKRALRCEMIFEFIFVLLPFHLSSSLTHSKLCLFLLG